MQDEEVLPLLLSLSEDMAPSKYFGIAHLYNLQLYMSSAEDIPLHVGATD